MAGDIEILVFTIMFTVAENPPLAAVIVARPSARAVTSPWTSTDAIDVSEEVQVNGALIAFPLASCAAASNGAALPKSEKVKLSGETETLATCCSTVIVAEAEAPSLVAVMVAVPLARPVTTPPVSTATTEESDVVHLNSALIPFPLGSCAAASNCAVSPRAAKVKPSGETEMLETRCSTVTVAASENPPLAAIIVATPLACAVTNPFASTVAIEVSDDDHMNCAVIALPLVSRADAFNRAVSSSASSIKLAGDTTTLAIRGGSLPPPPQALSSTAAQSCPKARKKRFITGLSALTRIGLNVPTGVKQILICQRTIEGFDERIVGRC